MTNNNELDPETADLISAAFAKSWRFVSTDPKLAYDDTEAMQIRLSKHLESLAKYGERVTYCASQTARLLYCGASDKPIAESIN